LNELILRGLSHQMVSKPERFPVKPHCGGFDQGLTRIDSTNSSMSSKWVTSLARPKTTFDRPDVNLLVYAYNSDAVAHTAARPGWENLLSG